MTVSKPLLTGLALTLSSHLVAADDLASVFKDGKVSGQIRAFDIEREYNPRNQVGATQNKSAFAIGGKLGFDTAPYEGFSAGAFFYTTNGLGLKNNDLRKADASLFGTGQPATFNGVATTTKPDITYLGQAYVNYQNGNTALKFGRQQLDTPLIAPDDGRMLPSLFEAYVLTNKDLPDTALTAMHVTRFNAGTFPNAFSKSGAAMTLGLQNGYGLGFDTGKYVSMKEEVLGAQDSTHNTAGVTVLSAINKSIPGTTAQLWDYYAWDMFNALFLQADYRTKMGETTEAYAGVQYLKENNIGNNILAKAFKDSKGVQMWNGVNSQMWGAKVGLKPLKGLDVYAAYAKVSTNTNGAFNGGIITPWGGSPAYAQGIVDRLNYVAGASTYKVGAYYQVMPELLTHLAYTRFGVGNKAYYYVSNNQPLTHASGETNLEVIYKPSFFKNLELKLRCEWARDFVPNQDFDEYRFIINYNF